MTPEQLQANYLIDFLGRDEAISHCVWVLSKGFGLKKVNLRDYWERVLACAKEEIEDLEGDEKYSYEWEK